MFALVSDTRNDPVWCPNVDTAELVSGDGVAVGSKFRFHQHLEARGRRVEFDADVEVTTLEERSISWLVTDRFQERRIELSVEPKAGKTRITQVTRASFHRKPSLVQRFAYPILAKRTLRQQFEQLSAQFTS